MSIKSILVHVDQKNSDNALQVAALLADKFSAHVNGVGVENRVNVPTYVTAELPRELLQSFAKQQEERLEESQKAFEKKMKDIGKIATASWESGIEEVIPFIGRRSRVNDLTIITQDNPNSTGKNIVDDVVVSAAGAVLVVPHLAIGETIGEAVTVAWNDSPESARAVRAALPFLKKAKSVDVIIISKSEEDQFKGSDVGRYLSEHGIEITLKIVANSTIDVANVILNNVFEKGHDLIVMGAFSHMRLREAILGGTTRNIFAHMTVPVIFSH